MRRTFGSSLFVLSARSAATPNNGHVVVSIFGECVCRICVLRDLVTRMIEDDRTTRLDLVRDIVRNHIVGADYSQSTEVRLLGLVEQFWGWCHDAEIRNLETIDREHVEAFLHAPVRRGSKLSAPRPKTIDNRLWAVERVYEALRYFGYRIPDPTQDIAVTLDRRIISTHCTDEEISALREAVPSTLFDDSYGLILALAEAGATNSEIRRLKASDMDFSQGLVSLPGGTRNDARTNELTPWGREVLAWSLATQLSRWLVVNTLGQAVSEQTISQRFRELVALARIRRRGVNINSVRAWRARAVYESSGFVQDAALFLGYRSLDTTAEMIGLDWRADS